MSDRRNLQALVLRADGQHRLLEQHYTAMTIEVLNVSRKWTLAVE